MSKHIHTTYYEDNYVKHVCYECEKSFIVGEELSKGCSLRCPYCGSYEVEWDAKTDEESIENLDMGCLGIYFDKLDLLAKEISIKIGGIYDDEQIKNSFKNIVIVVNGFKDSICELWENIKPIAEDLVEFMDKHIQTPKKNKDYPPYKSKFHTKIYYNKRIYYNCRNNC